MVLNDSHHEADVVFFQQTGAHFISGLFSWVAIIITCHQVNLIFFEAIVFSSISLVNFYFFQEHKTV